MWEKYSASCLLHFQVNGLYRLTIEKTKIKSAKQPSRSFFFFHSLLQTLLCSRSKGKNSMKNHWPSAALGAGKGWHRVRDKGKEHQHSTSTGQKTICCKILHEMVPSSPGSACETCHTTNTHTHTYTNFILVTSQCDTLGFFDILCRYVMYRIISF